MNEAEQRQMMMSCAFCGEVALPSPTGGMLTVRTQEGRIGTFAVHTDCVVARMHPNAQALLAAAPVIPEVG